jgi:kynurenine formamidase
MTSSFLPPDVRFLDLTQTLMPNIPNWDGGCGFEKKVLFDYDPTVAATDNETTVFLVQEINMVAGIGTHVDAPAHCCPGGACIADIPLEDLVSPCVLVDVSDSVRDHTYVVSMLDIEQFESHFGRIVKGCFVIFRTGWDKYWEDGSKYRNELLFPSISEEVARYLIETGVSGIGIDTLSPDCEGSGFPVHRIVLGAGKYIVENLTNLSSLPATGSTIMILPIKLHGCTEAPARVIAVL